MSEEQIAITAKKKYIKLVSICTIVNNRDEYRLMKNSFINSGFSEDCEYIIADNSDANNFDAYSAIRRFLQEANGRFIMIVHSDVRCIDTKEKLITILTSLEKRDPFWAICGNAGAAGYHNFFYNLNNKGKVMKSKSLPARVSSLDENLLIIKADSQLTISADINSFHLYGTDLCILADFLGYNAYVIDFMAEHLSLGNLKQLKDYKAGFLNKYGAKLKKRFIQTTCTKFILSNSVLGNTFYNSPFVFFFVKGAQRVSWFLRSK